jgi:hypothetical protein
MAGLTSRLEWASESDSLAASDGAGGTGDSTGATDIRSSTTIGITRGAPRFITGTIFTAEAARVVGLAGSGADSAAAPQLAAELPTEGPSGAAFTTVLVRRQDRSTATHRLRGDMQNRAGRVGFALARSAAMVMADRRGASRRAEARALAAAAADLAAAEGEDPGAEGDDNRIS